MTVPPYATWIPDRAGRVYVLLWFPVADAWAIRNADSSWLLLNEAGKIDIEEH